jgi:hypothetical protein
MAIVKMELDRRGLIDYAAVGREAKKEVRDVMKVVVNAGRKTARGLITSQFRRRTGKLAKQARGIRTNVTVKSAEVSGAVGPMPNLANIFEKGATIPPRQIGLKQAQALRFLGGAGESVFVRGKVFVKGFTLTARPTKAPTLANMEKVGIAQLDSLIERIAAK